MKILVCGKGGSGKSTMSVMLAKALKNRGYSVLLVDADESNFGLHRLLGIDVPKNLLESFGGKKAFKQKISKKNNVFPHNPSGGVFEEKWRIGDIPETCVSIVDDIRLLVIGKIHDFGEGCACPMGVLSKMFLDNLVLEENDMVVIDTEAGVEHFGRRVDAECDMIIGVVDPTYESFMLAGKIREMAVGAGKQAHFILNKVDDTVQQAMERHVDANGIIARIPKNDGIFQDALEGRKMEIDLPEMVQVCDAIDKVKAEL